MDTEQMFDNKMETKSKSDDFIHVKNKNNLSFKDMWLRFDLSDITLCFGEYEYHLHRFLLAACSPYFRSLFQKNPNTKKMNFNIANVTGGDLQRIFYYMYNGSVMIKNDDIQSFCMMLEKFWMPIPDDIIVTESDSESDTEREIDDGTCDQFVQKLRELFENLSETNVQKQSSQMMDLTYLEQDYLDVVNNLIVQTVLQPHSKLKLMVLLVKHICMDDKMLHFRENTGYFRDSLRNKVLKLFARGDAIFPMQRSPVPYINLNDIPSTSSSANKLHGIHSLDKQVNLMESIDSHCASLRYQRLAHFIGHLFQIKLIDEDEINKLIKENQMYEIDLRGKRHTNCCNFDVPQPVGAIFKDEWYKSVSPFENDMLWIRSEASLRISAPEKYVPIHVKRQLHKSQRKKLQKLRKEKLAQTANDTNDSTEQTEATAVSKPAKKKTKKKNKGKSAKKNAQN